MTSTIIGICGKKGSGKDTAADFLSQLLKFEKRAIAEPIKEICGFLFDFSDEQLDGGLKEAIDPIWGVSPRKAMQVLGTELFQKKLGEAFPRLAKDFWLKQLFKNFQGEDLVVSDVRKAHEASFLRKKSDNTLILRIDRPGIHAADLHLSETSIDEIDSDLVVSNDGSLDQFYERLYSLFHDMQHKNKKNKENCRKCA